MFKTSAAMKKDNPAVKNIFRSLIKKMELKTNIGKRVLYTHMNSGIRGISLSIGSKKSTA